ncbi:MAG: nucleoside hydrolase, partial [Clostridia bacterium]|nr:nucleoside hydrolase [Clostridia bacterium]
ALAIEKAPDIIDKIEVVWLGGNSFLSEKNDEFNFRQDVDAVRVVFESKVKLVVIPCKNVASYLQTTIYEQQHYLKDSGAIGEYLCDIFKKCKKAYRNNKEDEIGEAKTLWDLSAIAYCINKNWFKETEVSCPEILEDTSYKQTSNRHKITFVNFMSRHQIFKDFFVKMGYKYD